jgi:hypothetical protein
MLKKSLSLVTDLVRERLGTPLQLQRFLGDNAEKLHVPPLDTVPCTVSMSSVPRWHEWGEACRSGGVVFKAGGLLGWQTHRDFGYCSQRVILPALERFGCCMQIHEWHCELQEVDGLHDSDFELARFDTLDAMARQDMPMLINEVSSTRLAALLERHEIRALRRQRSCDHFVRHDWDGRVFLASSEASRYLAAARYIAARLGQRVALGSELRTYSIEPSAVSALRRDFELFAVSSQNTVASIGLHEAVRQLRVHYFSKRMPSPYAATEVIFLPRKDRRSMAVAAELRAAGFPDVGKHLSALVLRQHMNVVRYGQYRQLKAA